MSGEAQTEDRIFVALQGQTACVVVVNRATFKISTALKQFFIAARNRGAISFILDMTHCTGMDSTFMGVLAGLSINLKPVPDSRVVVANLSPKTWNLLATLGVDRLVCAYVAEQTPPDVRRLLQQARQDLGVLAAGPAGVRAAAETVAEAHEQLASLSEENALRFKNLLTFIKEDLKRGDL